jgi:hypothetical protein
MSGKAESRLIYNTISTSERVASLGVKGALLYTWLITHCDSQGRTQGKPGTVRAAVCPLLDDFRAEDVTDALDLMVDQSLIIRYRDEKGRELIQVSDWWDWQTGMKYFPPSHYQAPKGWNDKVTPRDEKGRFIGENKFTDSGTVNGTRREEK